MEKLAGIIALTIAVSILLIPAAAYEVEQFIENLNDEDATVRYNAVWALMEINDTKAVGPLIQALKDENATVRKTAALAFLTMPDSRAIEPLIQALKDEDSSVRENAAYALLAYNDPIAIDPLIDALKDNNSQVIHKAVWSLLSIGGDEAIDPLIQGLKMQGRTATITVGPSGCDYMSIQEAIDEADWGDIIEVQSGTYQENVDLNKPLALCGVGNPVINAGGKGSAITISTLYAILDGFTVTNVEDCGINVTGSWNIISSNNASSLGDAPGMVFYESDGNLIINNTANDCLEGLELYRSEHNELLSNTASHSKSSDFSGGISIIDSYENTIRKNILDDNVWYGIALAAYEPTPFENDTDQSGNEISDNMISGSENGILLLGSSKNIIQNNTVEHNQYGIKLITNSFDSTGNIICKNYLIDNQEDAFDEIDETIAATGAGPNKWDDGSVGNYYGNLKCIDGNDDGICDSQYSIPGGISVDRYPLAHSLIERAYQPTETLPSVIGQSGSNQEVLETGDPANRLNTLRDLLDAGLITQEDYDTKKAEILASL